MDKTIVVGAGLSGATIARLFAEAGNDVTVIDRRARYGGNAYDYVDKNGIIVQPYGPHVFHTHDKRVFEFLSEFTEWEKYEHKVQAKVKGKTVPVPFNITSLYTCYDREKADRIRKALTKEFGEGAEFSILDIKNHDNPEIRDFAEFVYKNIYCKYTKKQWKAKPEDLGYEVINRVPVTLSDNDKYFKDTYQFMPKKGFTEMVGNILKHPHIRLKLSVDAQDVFSFKDGKIYVYGEEFDGKVIYTGRVEEIFGYKFGILPYRTLRFKVKTYNKQSYQKTAVVNYTTSRHWTRVTEFTKFTCPPKDKTVIIKEYPAKCGKTEEPYYPIPVERNYALYRKYAKEAENYPNLYLLGRLARYEYIDMDDAVLSAMQAFEKINGSDGFSE